MLSNYLILCYPLILSSFFLSIKVFSNESAIHTEWPKYWSFSFSNSLSNEHSGLISFKIDMFDLFVVQGILEVFSQHHTLNESILQRSVPSRPNSHLYVTTGNTIALTIWTDFEGRLMSLLFNMLSWFAIAFLPRGKTLLISWLQSPSTVILKPVKMKLVTASTFPSSGSDGTNCHDLSFYWGFPNSSVGKESACKCRRPKFYSWVGKICSRREKATHSNIRAWKTPQTVYPWVCKEADRTKWISLSVLGFPCGSAGKETTCKMGDLGLIPGLGRSPGKGKGYPLQYSGLENHTGCIIHGDTKSRRGLSDFHFHFP